MRRKDVLQMQERHIKIQKTEDPQTRADSRMVNEGGLGAETYYDGNGQPNLPIHKTLNHLVADQTVLYMKIHQFHWYVQGTHFFTLHEKFEELYEQATVYMDEFAERLLAKKERPISTLQECLDLSVVEEKKYEEKMSAEEMVSELIADFGKITDVAKKGIQEAGEAGDDVTEDMLIEFVTYMDTTVWMLNAYIAE